MSNHAFRFWQQKMNTVQSTLMSGTAGIQDDGVNFHSFQNRSGNPGDAQWPQIETVA